MRFTVEEQLGFGASERTPPCERAGFRGVSASERRAPASSVIKPGEGGAFEGEDESLAAVAETARESSAETEERRPLSDGTARQGPG